MKTIKVLAVSISALFFSCTDDNSTNEPLGSYENGFFVLNEGGAGTLTYISNDLQTIQQDVFSAVNPGTDIGQYAQSVFFDGDRAFIISNGSNKITVANRYTMEYIATISTGLSVPRYGVVSGGKAFITNLADFSTGADDYLAVINLSDLSVSSPIAIGDFAERIVVANNKLFIANGAFGSGDSITVIDPITGTIIETIETGLAPNSLEEKDGVLYALCSAFGDAKLVRININTNEVIDSVNLPASMSGAMNLDVNGDFAYFSANSKVYKIDIDAAVITDTPLFDTESASDYIGYGFAVKGNRVYISEAAEDFASDGKILIYNTDGIPVAEIPVGLGPNGFYFN